MNAARVYLRKSCRLPPNINLPQSSVVGDDWNSVADISGWDLNDRVLEQGWHCIWVSGEYSRIGIGRSAEEAASKATLSALKAVSKSWNAAEIDSISVASYLAFCVARVTIHARQIQQSHVLAPSRTRGKVLHVAEDIS